MTLADAVDMIPAWIRGFLLLISEWANNNAGLVSLLCFLATILLGWATGILGKLMQTPRFTIRVLPGPTVCSTYTIGRLADNREVLRTAISLYLSICNRGSSAASIQNVQIGLRSRAFPQCLKRYWLEEVITLSDFCVDIGDGNLKLFPLLNQTSTITGEASKTYLRVGESVNGVVYFEQDDAWGSHYPRAHRGSTHVRVRITDGFGRRHLATVKVHVAVIDEARLFCRDFGKTLGSLPSRRSRYASDG